MIYRLMRRAALQVMPRIGVGHMQLLIHLK
jgi:hypothetical protein